MRRRPAEADGELRRLGEPGREKGGEEVPKNRKLTLDSLVLAMVTEEVGNGGNRARRAAAGGEEDGEMGGGSGLPGTIPWTRTTTATRRSFCSASVWLGEASSGGVVRVTAAGPWRPVREARVSGRGENGREKE